MASPPGLFQEFEFSFDPSLSTQFPGAPSLPSSADLFSQSETTDILGFLDDFDWELGQMDTFASLPSPVPGYNTTLPQFETQLSTAGTSGATIDATASTSRPTDVTTAPTEKKSGKAAKPASSSRSKSARQSAMNAPTKSRPTPPTQIDTSANPSPPIPSATEPSSAKGKTPAVASAAAESAANKALLSTPQKRLNHIQSEQKRRNAIRDGYAQLISLLSPGLPMPSRGRPKGKGDGATKGKSGVLFRAVEYVKFLEDGRNALKEEIARVEAL